MIDAIVWKFQTGSQWVHLPEKYGNWRGVYNRLRMWAVDGTWERVFTALVAQADADEDLSWTVSVDSTIVRAHQHAAGARKGAPADEPDDHAIGLRPAFNEATRQHPRLREGNSAQQDVHPQQIRDGDFSYGLDRVLDGLTARLLDA